MRCNRSLASLMLAAGVCQAHAADMPTKATVQSTDQTWTASFNSEVRYFYWTNTRGYPTTAAPLSGHGHGSEIYTPLSLSVSGLVTPDWKLDVVVRGGYVRADQYTRGEHGSVATTTDTETSATVTYNGFTGFQPFASLLTNIPTGKAALYGSSQFARMDPDLVDISTFGEGWNFGPTAGVNIPITPEWMLTLSGGYTARLPFDKEGNGFLNPQPTDRIKNGDETTVTASLGYTEGALLLQGSASYSWDQDSYIEELGATVNHYKIGPRTTITGFAAYTWTPQWSSTLNLMWTHTASNTIVDGTGAFVGEPFNSNNDIFRADGVLTYQFDNGATLGPTASFLYRRNNSYDPTSFSFVPAKTRWGLGLKGGYNVTNAVNLNARFEHVWIEEGMIKGTGPTPTAPDMSGQAWAFALGANVNF